jgi:hypothetical protein
MEEMKKEGLFMKARKSILGLILVIGMLLSCVGASYAATAAAPKFTTTKLADGTHGGTGDWEIKADNISDGGSISVADSVKTVLEGTYGLAVGNDETTGALTLTAEELATPTPSAGYKFKVTAKNSEGTKVDKEYTLKILAVAPSTISPATNTDISSLAAAAEGSSYPVKGEAIKDVEITVAGASPTVALTASGLPNGLKIEAGSDNPTSGVPADFTFKITGTPKASGKFNITVTAANSKSTLTSGKATAKYVLNVLETPGLKPDSAKDVTYGKSFSQKFTVTGMPKGISLSEEGTNVKIYAEEGATTDITGTTSGITGEFDSDKGVFTVSGTPVYNEFGSANSETVYLVFSLASPAASEPTEVKMPLKIQAIAPTFTNKTEAQDAVSKLKLNTAIEGGIPVKVDGPGTIAITVDPKTPLPAGLEGSAATDDDGVTAYTITGTPEVTAKGYTVNLTAANAKGSSKLALKFTIDADAPIITADVDEAYANWAVGSGDMTINLEADRPVTWKATNLPKGLTLELASVDKNAKVSQWAQIKGNPTAAMKEDKFITVTATDPDLKKTSDALVLEGDKLVFVHSKPTIKTTRLSDIKIGSPYSATVKATDATTWSVIEGTFAELEGITFDSSDPAELKIGGTITETPVGEDGKPTATAKLKLQVSGSGGDSDPVEIEVKIKGDTPKFSTSSLSNPYTKAGAEKNEIVVKGAMPIDVKAYITVKDAKSAGITVTKDIEIGENAEGAEGEYTGFYYTVASSDNADELVVTLTKAADTGGSFKKLGVTLEASNAFSGKNGTTKTFKADMTGEAPKWTIAGKVGDEEYEADTEIGEDLEKTLKEGLNFTAGDADQVNLTFTASGDAPLTITASPNKDTNGLTIKEEGSTVTVTSTKDSTAKSTKLTLTVKNGEGSKKIAVTLNGQDKPKIKVPTDGYKKEVEQGKKVSIALSLESGTKPITWGIDDEGGEDAITAADLKETYGIELDEDKGKLEGTPEHATVTDEGEYKPVVVYVYAENAAGSNDAVPVTIGVTGSKPKLASDSKNITLETKEELTGDTAIQLEADEIAPEELVWAVEEKGKNKTLGDYVTGLTLNADGTITGTPTAAVKNVSVPLIISHYGNEQKASVKISVFDQKPAFDSEGEYTIELDGVEVDDKKKTKDVVTATLNVTLTEETVATGASKITWKASKPDESVVTVKLENPTPTDAHYNTVKITATIAKGKSMSSYMEEDAVKGFTTTFTLTATNSGRTSDKSAEQEITIKVNGGGDTSATSPEDKTIGETKELEDDVVTDDELTRELGEGELTIGTERTVGMLTSGQAAILDEGRFVIAAILPEISATADGQYGLEVDLAENVKPGAKLYWFAFPKDAPDSEDDAIIDFFEVNGTDTEVVPENRVVVAYPWFRAGVTYGPVIAVKAEDAESGDALTEGELEGTAETKAAE